MLDPGGSTLIDDTQLSNGSVEAGWPVIAVDSQDKVHVAWQDDEWVGEWHEPRMILHTKIDPATHPQDGSAGDASMNLVDDQLISTGDPQSLVKSTHPHLASDGQGRIHVVWSAWPEQDMGEYFVNFLEVHHAVIGSDGQMEVSDHGVYQSAGEQWDPAIPKVAVDSLNQAHLVWAGLDAEYSTRIYYTMLDSMGTTLIGTTSLTSETAGSGYPSVDVAPENKIVVVFESREDWDQPYNVSMMTLDPSLVEHDGNPAETSALVTLGPIAVATGSNSASMVPSAVVDGSGNVHLCYYGGDSDWSPRDLLFKVVDQGGNTLVAERAATEGPTARSNSTDTGEIILPALSVSNQGSYVVWTHENPEGPWGVSDVMMRILHPLNP
jgi:hypothetical protein